MEGWILGKCREDSWGMRLSGLQVLVCGVISFVEMLGGIPIEVYDELSHKKSFTIG